MSTRREVPSPVIRCLIACVFVTVGCGATTAAESPEDSLRSVLVPLPVIFYTPETHLAFGGSVSYIHRAEGSTLEDRPSSFNGTVILTTRSQLLAAFGADHYWGEERQRAMVGIAYRKFPDEFFGIGNDTSDDGENYTDEGSSIGLDYLFEVFPQLRLGGGLFYGSSSITDTEADAELATGRISGATGGQAAGAGLQLDFDSRDNISFPGRGGLYDLVWRVYGSVLGGDYELNSVALDLRQYLSLGRQHVIALRALGSSSGGNVPFQLMPALGGQNLMRGYFAGRFRDRKAVAAQIELRSQLWRRFGGVLFGSLGQVAARTEEIAADRFHFAYGFGLRFLVVRQEGLNLRLDWGFSDDQSGFYLGLGEAF